MTGADSTAKTGWPFDPASERYVSLSTRRRDGREVLTPVWLVAHEGRAFVFSAGKAGKVKRLRREPRARMAPCSMRGAVHGPWVAVRGTVLGDDDAPLQKHVYVLLRRKYGLQMAVGDLFSWITGRIHARVVLAFSPVSRSADA